MFHSTKSDVTIKRGFQLVAFSSLFVIFLIFIFLGRESFPFFIKHPLNELLQTRWMPISFIRPTFGVLPLINGTLLITLLASVLAVPSGILCALYLSELAGRREKEWLKVLIELLAGVPSVVIGFFGLVVLAPLIKTVFHLPSGQTALTGAVVLALMALPTIITLSEDAIRAVPAVYKHASLALGASPIQTLFKVTLPAALPGVMAAVMLGVGRVVGETMAVMMVTGNAAILTWRPFDSARTMTATIAAEMGEVPHGSDHYNALFCIGVLLLIMTLFFNQIARRFLRKAVRA